MKIYIISANKKPIIENKDYELLQVGADLNKDIDISKTKDNKGDNISKKNRNYCELTGLYWIWKHSKEKIIGLVHYRRFFYKNLFFKNKKVINQDEVEKILQKYDIILPTMGHTYMTVYQQYNKYHDINDLLLCGNIIKEKYSEYYPEFEELLTKKKYYPFNMFIAKKELIDEYCQWLFDILLEAEKTINETLDQKDKYNKRVYGFLSERLFNVWINTKKLKIKELPVYNVERKKIKEISIEIIKRLLNILRRK